MIDGGVAGEIRNGDKLVTFRPMICGDKCLCSDAMVQCA